MYMLLYKKLYTSMRPAQIMLKVGLLKFGRRQRNLGLKYIINTIQHINIPYMTQINYRKQKLAYLRKFLLKALVNLSVVCSWVSLQGNNVGLQLRSSRSSECQPVSKCSLQILLKQLGTHPFLLTAFTHALLFVLLVGN